MNILNWEFEQAEIEHNILCSNPLFLDYQQRERSDSFIDLLSTASSRSNLDLRFEQDYIDLNYSPNQNPEGSQIDIKLSPHMSEDFMYETLEDSEIRKINFENFVNFNDKLIGTLTREERNNKIEKYRQKKMKRKWGKRINYNCRKKVADGRVRIKGRFVTKEQAISLIMAKTN